MFKEYLNYDGLGLATLMRNKEVSYQEVLAAAIDQAEKTNPAINAIIHKMYEQAQQQLQSLDPSLPFAGVPYLLKDLGVIYAGEPYNAGSKYFRHFVPPIDSEIVIRLKKAGLITLAKTTVPEFGLSYVTESQLSQATRNPWNLQHTCGGSSGGAAAGVAAGMTPIAHANDGGGSIRVPASCCGLFGLKPSRGRTPSGPIDGKSWQGAVINHAITRSVRDSAAILDILAGSDLGAPFIAPPQATSFLSECNTPPGKLRIALCKQPLFPAQNTHPDCIAAVTDAAQLCESLGHHVVEAAPVIAAEKIAEAFTHMVVGEMAALIDELTELFKRKPERAELELPTRVAVRLGRTLKAHEFAKATHVLDHATRAVAHFFTHYDILLTPTLAQPPVKIGHFNPNPVEAMALHFLNTFPVGYLLKLIAKPMNKKLLDFSPNTTLFNISGNPAMSVPLYWNQNNLPIGTQFVAPYGEEAKLFRLAAQLEQARPWKTIPINMR